MPGGRTEVENVNVIPSWGYRGDGCTTTDDYYLLDQVDTSEQVHSEIDENPVNAFSLVLFLLKYEHVVVKELLQSLIGEVNADLLETVVLL